MAIQMVVMVVVCVWAGMKLDEYQQNQIPGWTVGLTVFGIIAALVYLFRTVKSN
ncbi:MAG: hypothetical protein HKN32_00265 [Flavobacteriales bacterium]|nr:hypothetical protein [Flavobacteriales bacterium]